MGFVVVDGGRERPDARWGAVWRAAPGEGGFVIDGYFCLFVVLKWVHVWISKWMARELSGGGEFQNSKSCALLCEPSGVATYPLTWVG
jgi:hypothetical protein